jgi:hypothetical protein
MLNLLSTFISNFSNYLKMSLLCLSIFSVYVYTYEKEEFHVEPEELYPSRPNNYHGISH